MQIFRPWMGEKKIGTKATEEESLLNVFLAKICIRRLRNERMLISPYNGVESENIGLPR